KQFSVAIKKDNSDWEAWYYLGLARSRENDFKGARKALEKSAGLKPEKSRVHSAWAYVLLLSDKNSDAEREASRAIDLNHQDADPHYVIGVVRLRQSRNADALSEAETAIRLEASLAPAYLLKSQVLLGIYSEQEVAKSRVVTVPAAKPDAEELAER